MSEGEWLDIVAAAERHDCSPKTIRRYVKQRVLPARTETVSGRGGHPVIKILIRVSDLDDALGWTAREERVRKIRASAGILTKEQGAAIRKVFLEHVRDREASAPRG